MTLEIHAIVTGELAASVGEILINGGPADGCRPYGYDEAIPLPDGSTMTGIRQPVPVFLITGGEKVILVDTGMGSAGELIEVFRNHGMEIYCRKEAEWEIEKALAGAGLAPEDIDIVFHTHLHYDHIGNNETFERARFLVPPEEMDWALNPPHHWGAGPYFPEFGEHVRSVQDRISLLGREGEVIPGVEYFRLGAHSPGFTAIAVETALGRIVLAGDIMFDTISVEHDWPSGFYYRLDEFAPAYERIHAEADIIIPGHDWKVWDEFPDLVIGPDSSR